MDENQNNEQPVVQTNNTAPKNEKKGFNITSMILGIIGLVCICVWYVGLPCAIIAIIFSIAGKEADGRGMGIAGLVLGIVTLALYAFIFLLAIIGTVALSSAVAY